MVDHLTRVYFDAAAPGAAALAAALARRGFALRRERHAVLAESTEVEGQEVKAYLRGCGFADRQFQVFVEFVRKGGIL